MTKSCDEEVVEASKGRSGNVALDFLDGHAENEELPAVNCCCGIFEGTALEFIDERLSAVGSAEGTAMEFVDEGLSSGEVRFSLESMNSSAECLPFLTELSALAVDVSKLLAMRSETP